MKKEFYYKPTQQPKYLHYLLWCLLILCLLAFFALLPQLFQTTNHKSSTIKDLVVLISPIIAITSYLWLNKGLDLTIPMFIFDEQRLVFNHPNKGFEIDWQDIEKVDVSIINPPRLIILTKSKKYKIDMQYFQSTEDIDVYNVFKDYAIKYSGKKLIL